MFTKSILIVTALLMLAGCSSFPICRDHPGVCDTVAAIAVGSVAATVAASSHHSTPSRTPDHLAAATQAVNLLDMDRKGRRRTNNAPGRAAARKLRLAKPTCKWGHHLQGPNLVTAPGYRVCRQCGADAATRYRDRQKARAALQIANVN